MTDIIIIALLVVIIALAGIYVYKAKKNGKKCIGCPDSASCSKGKCNGACHACSCGCSSKSAKNAEEDEQ